MSNKPPRDDRPDGPGLMSNKVTSIQDAIPTEAEGDALFDELFGAFEDGLGDELGDEIVTQRPPPPQAGPDAGPREGADGAASEDDLLFDDAVFEDAEDEPRTGEFDELADTNQLPAAQLADELPAPPPARPEPYAQPYQIPPVRPQPPPPLRGMPQPGPPPMPRGHTPPIPSVTAHGPPAIPTLGEAVLGLDGLGPAAPPAGGEPFGDDFFDDDLPPPDGSLKLDEDAVTLQISPEQVQSAVAGLAARQAALQAQQPPSPAAPPGYDEHAATVQLDPAALAQARAAIAAGRSPAEPSQLMEVGEVAIDESDIEALEMESVEVIDESSALLVDSGVAFDISERDPVDAVVSLMQQGERDAWVERAVWLYAEAPPPNEPAERAQALLVISELLAMAGEEERAETVAREALQLAPSSPIAHRQLRGILMARGRWTEVADALDGEARVAPTPEARLHAAYLGAEVARLAEGDPDTANRRLDVAERVTRGDARLQIARVSQALASGDEVADVHLDGEAAEAIRDALSRLASIRTDGGIAGVGDTPHTALLAARSALRKRDMRGVLHELGRLERFAELAGGAGWLIASLAGAHPELRGEAIAALSRVAAGSHGHIAQRARAARAIEAGDVHTLIRVANEADAEVLSPAERLVLAALCGQPLDELYSWLARAQSDDELAPLAGAVAALLADADQANAYAAGDDVIRAAVALGRQLGAAALEATGTASEAAGDDAIAAPETPLAEPSATELDDAILIDDEVDAVEDAVMGAVVPPPMPRRPASLRQGVGEALSEAAVALSEADPQHGAARAVLLEHCYLLGQTQQVIDALAAEGAEGLERERSLAAALLAETADDHARMASELARATASAPHDAAALRMSMVVSDQLAAATALIRHADALSDPVRRAIALTEAGLRLMEVEGQEADGESILRRASETAIDLPVASFIGMYIAGALGDADGERYWLEQRRVAAGEPNDAVADTLRLALRIGASDPPERARLLAEAHRARPDDDTLRDMYEQAAGVVEDRAAWLLERAEASGGDAAAAALEAALAFELDGDVAQAAATVQKAVDAGDTGLAQVFAQRYALEGHGSSRVIELLESRARQAGDAHTRSELAQQIARIEALGRGERARAIAVLRGVLDDLPDDLLALQALESAMFAESASEGLGEVAMAIARAVSGPDRVAHAWLAARLCDGAEQRYDAVSLAFDVEHPSAWAMREMARHAKARGDYTTAAGIERELAEMATHPLDRATLLLRAGESAITGGEEEAGAELIAACLEVQPRHPIALWLRAAQLERVGDPADAAQAYEELAMSCQAPRERASKLYKAAILWLSLEDGSGQAEGRRLLEAVCAIDAEYQDTFERLQQIYVATGAKRELAELLSARIEAVTDPAQRIELEVRRGKMLVEAGDASQAREALSAALEANPDNAEALSAYADVCAAEGDYEAVEQAIIRLGRLVSDPNEQVGIYLRLGTLYDKHLPNPERAEMAYREVLKRAPDNLRAREKLVDLALARGDTQRAFEQQEELIEAATSLADKCARTVRLAEIHEAAGDVKEAEQLLIKARRTWNKEAAPVSALYRFYKRNGQEPAAEMLLDRAAAEVRRGLGAGRFEAPLFAMAQMVADMRGQADAAEVARVTLAAIEGEPAYIEGAGVLAGQPELDMHSAPEIFSEAFRSLLKASGQLLDDAAPFDLKSLRAKPLPPPHADVLERTRELAAGYGLPDVNVVATNALGLACIPARCDPPTLCFGLPLVTSDRADIRDFMIHRALKVLQTKTAALSRTAPIDLWPLVAAYLKLHSPSFNPAGVDPDKVQAFHAAMAPHAHKPNPQVSLLAAEVISTIGNRASSLNTVSNAWGSRTALIAMGDPNLALEAIAWANGHSQGPPASGADRVRWIGRQAEARDIIVFSVSDGYAAARAQLGLDAALLEAVEID